MDITKMIDFWIFMAALCIAGNISKKEPERFQKLMTNTLGYVMSLGLIFSFLEFLALCGIKILEVAWSFSPLDIMSAVSCLFFFALCSEKWSLTNRQLDGKKSDMFKNPLKWWHN